MTVCFYLRPSEWSTHREQLDYFRICYIAFNLVPESLRKIFKQEWNFRYKTTPFGEWKDTPQNGRDFYSNESRRNRTKYARYLATIQNGNTTEWDCSCLGFAILLSDSIGTTLSPAISKDVDDLRQVRNDIAHISEVRLTDSEFKNYVSRVLRVFTSLGLSVNDIKAVKNQTSFPTAELRQAKSNLHVTQTILQRKEKEVKTLASDLLVAQTALQTKEEEVEALTTEINPKAESSFNLTFTPPHEISIRSKKMKEHFTFPAFITSYVFPRLYYHRLCFPAFTTGYVFPCLPSAMFSRVYDRSCFSRLRSLMFSHVYHRLFFPCLSSVMFSRVCHRLCFPAFTIGYVFPRLPSVIFSAFTIGYVFTL